MTNARSLPAVALAAALAGCGIQSIPQGENAVAAAWGEVQLVRVSAQIENRTKAPPARVAQSGWAPPSGIPLLAWQAASHAAAAATPA